MPILKGLEMKQLVVTVECLVCKEVIQLTPGQPIPPRCPSCSRVEW